MQFPGRGSATRISGVLYHRGETVVYARMPGGPGWPSLLEKAYAVWRGRNSYNRLDLRSNQNAPDGGQVICDLVGRHDMLSLTENHLYSNVDCTRGTADSDRAARSRNRDIIAMATRARQRPTIAGSRSGQRGHDIVADHAYAVLRMSHGRVRLRNPHGGNGANVGLTPAEFASEFQAIWQAR